MMCAHQRTVSIWFIKDIRAYLLTYKWTICLFCKINLNSLPLFMIYLAFMATEHSLHAECIRQLCQAWSFASSKAFTICDYLSV